MAAIKSRPTYQGLILELEAGLECIELALAQTALPGRVRWRLTLRRDRIIAVVKAARQTEGNAQ